MIIDGLKLLIEIVYCQKECKKYSGKHDDVTIVVAAYNEAKTIEKTLESLVKIVPVQNIIIADDGSKDCTAQIVKNYNSDVLVLTDTNKGKVGAIHRVLPHVRTSYVLLMDADTVLEDNFIIPTEALENNDATAVAFNIATTSNNQNWFSRLLLNIQSHEYSKSMQIGKRFSNPTRSVHCISGAIGLFKTERLRELAKSHTTIFQGEDLERSLLELVAGGNIIFSESTAYTDVPSTIKKLSKQRVVGWWPGLWRNMYLFFKLVIKRREPIRLRYELLYEIFAIVSTPFKIISLISLFVMQNWNALLLIFLTYLVLEFLVYFRIKTLAGRYMKMDAIVILLFPLYSILQMFYVAIAFFVFIYKKYFTKEWVRVAMFIIISSIPFGVRAEKDKSSGKKDYTVDVSYSRIEDSKGDRSYNNLEAYFGYKKLFASLVSEPYNSISAGGYFGSFLVNTRYQFESQNFAARLQYEKWFGNFFPYVFAGYGTSELSSSVSSSSSATVGIGLGCYFENRSTINLSAVKEFSREYGITFIAKTKLVYGSKWCNFGASITSFGDPGFFAQVGYKIFYIHCEYYKNFDYSNFNRSSFGLGLKFNF